MNTIPVILIQHSDSITGFLSNQFFSPFVVDQKRWTTVTHYVIANLFLDSEVVEEIRNKKTVREVLRFSKNVSISQNIVDIRKNIKIALAAKFSNPILAKSLLETYPAKFVIIDEYEKYKKTTCTSLEIIRAKLYLSKLEKQPTDITNQNKKKLSEMDVLIINQVLKLSKKISYPMVHKSINSIIFTKEFHNKYLSIKLLPQHEPLICEIQKIALSFDVLQKYSKDISQLLLQFILWIDQIFESSDIAIEKEEIIFSDKSSQFEIKIVEVLPNHLQIKEDQLTFKVIGPADIFDKYKDRLVQLNPIKKFKKIV